MNQQVELQGKIVNIFFSRRAERALANLESPLVAEMELYFSCLIRKAVRFSGLSEERPATPVRDKFLVRFRPVGSRSCGVKLNEGKPPLEDFPVVNPEACTPDWLEVDFRNGEWKGHFGYGKK